MLMNRPRAFIFDLNGTMIDDMAFHVKAWYRILNEDLGAGLNVEQVKSQMYGKNTEVLERIFGKDHFTHEEAEKISLEKERRYQQSYRPHLKLIEGLPGFLEAASRKKIPMAVGSAALPFNIDFVLDNLNIRHYFSAIVSADDVVHSKPDPETYLKAASGLRKSPGDCLVFEDAPKGVESAERAGMQSVVLTTMHAKEDFNEYSHILAFVKDYREPYLQQLL
jgi:beta-phosphoglucomutase